MALAATKCWFIWKERRLRIFEDKSRTPTQLSLDIIRHYDYWHPIQLHNTSLVNISHIKTLHYWQFPRMITVKLNCDASWISEHTNAGFGLVLRNSSGTFRAAECGWCRTFSAQEAEAVALLRTVQWAIKHNVQNLEIEGDNQATIKFLQGKTKDVNWQCLAILEEVQQIAVNLVSFKGFQYVDRRANKVADLLAKEGRRSSNTTS